VETTKYMVQCVLWKERPENLETQYAN